MQSSFIILISLIKLSGRKAIDALLADGRRLAEQLSGAEKQELLDTMANIERLTKQLDDLKRAGKVI